MIFSIRKPIGKVTYTVLSILGFIIPLLVWQLVVRTGMVNHLFLPSPDRVWRSLVHWQQGTLWEDTYISIKQVVLGFIYAAVIAIPLGIAIGLYKPVEGMLQAINDFFRYMPASAFIPLVLLWIGIGDSAKVSIIFIGVFFQIIVLTADAIRNVPQEYLDAMFTMGAKQSEVVALGVVHAAAPDIVNLLRVNMGWAWTYLVVAEMVAANRGLGFAIMQAQKFMDTPRIFAGIFVIGLLGVTFDLIFRGISRVLFPWKS
jgi:NitT/TauT family transport system permease protein